MNCALILVLAVLGSASAAILPALGHAGVYGPTVSETVISPFHRTDAITGPCSKTVVHTTTAAAGALPLRRTGFLGAGFAGRGVGFLSGGIYPSGGLVGSLRGGIYAGTLGHHAVMGSDILDGDVVTGGLLGGAFAGGHYGYENGLIA